MSEGDPTRDAQEERVKDASLILSSEEKNKDVGGLPVGEDGGAESKETSQPEGDKQQQQQQNSSFPTNPPSASNILPSNRTNQSSPTNNTAPTPTPEVVHLHIVKLIHQNPTPGAPPFEVLDVVEGPAQPFLETVRAYPHQVLPATNSPAEREQALRQLKMSVWYNFVESVNAQATAANINTAGSQSPSNGRVVSQANTQANVSTAAPAPATNDSSSNQALEKSKVQYPKSGSSGNAPTHTQTPIQQLYTDHYLQQQQQQQQQQMLLLQQQQQQQQMQQYQQQMLLASNGGVKAPFADVDSNYSYWHQNQASKDGNDSGLSTIPPSMLDKRTQKQTKATKRERGNKSNTQKDKAKKEKLQSDSSAKLQSSTGGKAGSEGGQSNRKRKAPGGEERKPRGQRSRNSAKSIPLSGLSQQTKMAKCSGVGTAIPTEASWFPFPPTLDGAVAIFSKVQQKDEEKKSNPSFNDYRQMLQKMNTEIAEKKEIDAKRKQDEKDLMAATSSDSILLPPADDINFSVTKPRGKDKHGKDDVQEEWVQCDDCGRWRTLPPAGDALYPQDLPEHWTCTMNTWNPSKASCSVPEETSSASQQTGALRAKKMRIWVRRLRSGDKYEAKHSNKSMIDKEVKGVKKFGEVDWIRCSNPYCGKWRACLRSINGQKIRRENETWFCWMNSWDEARSSCNAPQEDTAVHSLGAPYVSGDKKAGEEDDVSVDGSQDDSASERGSESAVVQGISRRGRVVRSRWNSRRSRK